MAHDRPDCLDRLLRSMPCARAAATDPLVVSIDGGGDRQAEVEAVARSVDWPGPVEVQVHDRLGLVDHFHRCGDLARERGRIVLLEDDLVVGPGFARWAGRALDATEHDDRIAGVCLSAPWFEGYRHLPFEPIADGSSGFYAQLPWYDGMAWNADMWQRYRTWTPSHPVSPIHHRFDELGDDEWLPHAIRYLVDTDRYYVLPHQAHATNSGAAGTHFATSSDFFQVPLVLDPDPTVTLADVDDALGVYDDHLELTGPAFARLCPALAALDPVVGLHAVRDLAPYEADRAIVTTRPVRRAMQTWGGSMRPLALNLHFSVAGHTIRLAKIGDVIGGRLAEHATAAALSSHAHRGRPPSLRSALLRHARRPATWGMYGRR